MDRLVSARLAGETLAPAIAPATAPAGLHASPSVYVVITVPPSPRHSDLNSDVSYNEAVCVLQVRILLKPNRTKLNFFLLSVFFFYFFVIFTSTSPSPDS